MTMQYYWRKLKAAITGELSDEEIAANAACLQLRDDCARYDFDSVLRCCESGVLSNYVGDLNEVYNDILKKSVLSPHLLHRPLINYLLNSSNMVRPATITRDILISLSHKKENRDILTMMLNDTRQMNDTIRVQNATYVLWDAIQQNNMDLIQYLLTSQELILPASVSYSENRALRYACEYGHLPIVKYLLTCHDLIEHADIGADRNDSLRLACEKGHLDVVRYLLTSPDLKEHANVNESEDKAYWVAYKYGHLDIVNFLLSLKETIYIDFQSQKYRLEYAIEHQHDDIIEKMLNMLVAHQPLLYLEKVELVEKYARNHGKLDWFMRIVASDNTNGEHDLLL